MRNGYSLIEVVVVVAVAGTVLLLGGYTLRSSKQISQSTETLETASLELMSAVRLIQKVGRIAQLCRKNTVASLDALECNIDFTRPAVGQLTWVRFTMNNGEFQYQWDQNNDGAFSAISKKQGYASVKTFVVCNDADMAAGGSCPLRGTALSTFHSLYNLPAKQDRYFRFSVQTQVPGPGNSGQRVVNYQSAFYRRNPTPFTSGPLVVYQW